MTEFRFPVVDRQEAHSSILNLVKFKKKLTFSQKFFN